MADLVLHDGKGTMPPVYLQIRTDYLAPLVLPSDVLLIEIAVKDEYPSSSVATQQNSKFTNEVVDTVKRKCPFSDIETSSSSDDSSVDYSFIDNLPISSVVSQGKKTKM
jgi:hypothetical protein